MESCVPKTVEFMTLPTVVKLNLAHIQYESEMSKCL